MKNLISLTVMQMIFMFAGCGATTYHSSSVDESQALPLVAPEIEIIEPSDKDIITWNTIQISGKIISDARTWKPNLVVVVVSRDKLGIQEFASVGVKPKAEEDGKTYKFETSLRAPAKPGKYYVTAIVQGAGSADKNETRPIEIGVKK